MGESWPYRSPTKEFCLKFIQNSYHRTMRGFVSNSADGSLREKLPFRLNFKRNFLFGTLNELFVRRYALTLKYSFLWKILHTAISWAFEFTMNKTSVLLWYSIVWFFLTRISIFFVQYAFYDDNMSLIITISQFSTLWENVENLRFLLKSVGMSGNV